MTISRGRFEGKVAVVTASTQGIGFGIAERLGLEGASVVISSRKQKNVDEAVENLKSKGIEVFGMACHVSSAEQRENLIKSTVQKYGQIDILVSNAAANPSLDPIVTMSEKALDKLWEVNVKASVQIVQAAVPHLSEDSSITFISSITGYNPSSNLAMYGVTKTALLGLTKTNSDFGNHGILVDPPSTQQSKKYFQALAAELGPKTRVNAIAPGFVPTHFADAIMSNPVLVEHFENQTFLKRFGTVGDMAGTVAFLASSDASYITGETIVVAGGTQSRL